MPTMNAAGIALTKEFEQCFLFTYDDGAGVYPPVPFQPKNGPPIGTLTIGWGHTSFPLPATCTQEQADTWLLDDLQSAETEVSELVQIALTPNEFSALVDWEFNTGGLAGSPGLELINRKQFEEAWDQHFCLWLEPDPVGLARRRAAEKALFFTPTDPADAAGPNPTGGAEEIPA